MGILDAYFLGRPCTCEQQRQDFTDLAVDTERSKRERRFMGGMITCFRDGLCIFWDLWDWEDHRHYTFFHLCDARTCLTTSGMPNYGPSILSNAFCGYWIATWKPIAHSGLEHYVRQRMRCGVEGCSFVVRTTRRLRSNTGYGTTWPSKRCNRLLFLS